MARAATVTTPSAAALRCRRKFLRFFPSGFADETYFEWERGYKQLAHERWDAELGRLEYRARLNRGDFEGIAATAVKIESRTNLLFSFEKMALRDAVKRPDGARAFAEGLYALLYGRGHDARRFDEWCAVVASLPRRQTRVLTWPVVTVFPFIACPDTHLFVKPRVTQVAAREYGVDFHYVSRPNAETYDAVLRFAALIRRDQADLGPRDMIDLQGFIWVQGSDEYEE
jgi:hypothetical protein